MPLRIFVLQMLSRLMVDAAGNDHLRMQLRAALRTLPALAVAAVAGALASGCGSGSAGAVLDPVANAAQTTNNADGARVAMQIAVTVTGVPQQVTIDADGRIAFKSQEGEIAMQLNGVPGAAAGGLGEGGTIDERFLAGKMFMSSSAFAGKLPSGASWIEIDLAEAVKKLGFDPSALSSGQSNPAQFLEYLRASGGGVIVTGTERVRGVETTRYSGTIDLRKVPGADSAAAKQAIDGIVAATGTSTIPVQVWVDSKKLVRKLSLTMPLSLAGRRIETKVSEEFFDFGPQPAVQAPAASETYELPASGLSGLGAGA
jgi:hypothetical protein